MVVGYWSCSAAAELYRYATNSKIKCTGMNKQIEYFESKLSFEIDSWDLKAAMEAGKKVLVIDARSPSSYQVEHIPGAINIPHLKMSEETTKHLDRASLVVTYCDGIGCNASTKGALKMLKLGFQVKELIGGLDWWKRDGHSTEFAAAVETIGCGCSFGQLPTK